jgi:hypothetical protein
MPRLRRSADALVRAAQMRRARLQIYTEGNMPDVYVYEKVARAVCASSWDYVIITPKELPEGYAGTGKSCLRKWYNMMRRRKLLSMDFKSHGTQSAFIFDKDIDDIRRTKCRSPHVIYTTFYDIENHVYSAGGIADAVAAMFSLTHSQVSVVLANEEQWRLSAAERWKEWVVFSIASITLGVGLGGYASNSQIHKDFSKQHDLSLTRAAFDKIKQRASISASDVDRKLAGIRRIVDARYSRGRHDEVFKGKWYPTILEKDLAAAGFPVKSLKGSFSSQLLSLLAHTLNPHEPWADFIRAPLEQLITSPRSP